MTYKCMNCGATSEDSKRLCNPGTEELEGKLCATSTDQVCGEHLPKMKYNCATCGGLAPDAGHLCDPKKVIRPDSVGHIVFEANAIQARSRRIS